MRSLRARRPGTRSALGSESPSFLNPALKHHFRQRACAQIVVDGPQLVFARGGNADGKRLIAAVAAIAHPQASLVEIRRMAAHHLDYQLLQTLSRIPQDFNGVVGTGKFDFGGFRFSHDSEAPPENTS